MRITECCECSKKTVLCSASSPPTTPGLPLSQQQFNLLFIILIEMPDEVGFTDQAIFLIAVEPLNNTAVAPYMMLLFLIATGHLLSPLLIRHTSHLKQAHSEHGAPPKYKKTKQSFSAAAMAHGVLWTSVVWFGRAVQTASRQDVHRTDSGFMGLSF